MAKGVYVIANQRAKAGTLYRYDGGHGQGVQELLEEEQRQVLNATGSEIVRGCAKKYLQEECRGMRSTTGPGDISSKLTCRAPGVLLDSMATGFHGSHVFVGKR